MRLEGKRIILGVTGSIAAYKACGLIRMFRGEGASVSAVLTESGEKFITPLTLATLTGNPVYTSMFRDPSEFRMHHISLAEACDLLIIAPASANTISKLSQGLADNLLTTLALAVKSPVIIAPAMNDAMYENPVMSENVGRLKARGFNIVEPQEGRLASGKTGRGRLAEAGHIFMEAERAFVPACLEGRNLLVSAGPTREPLDAVRFISNPSTGRMGFEVARAARLRGARVVLVSGPSCLAPPPGVLLIRVKTAREMRTAIFENFETADAAVMAAAVSDFRPAETSEGKLRKESASTDLKLSLNPDILREMGERKAGRVLAGFSMDTSECHERAYAKLKAKNLDFIVSNDISIPGSGFEAETNIISIIDVDGSRKDYPRMPKSAAAGVIADKIATILNAGNPQLKPGISNAPPRFTE